MCGLDTEKTREVVERLKKARVITLNGDAIQVTSLASLEQFIKFLEMKEQFGE
jgi:hypothetical protein